MQDIYKGRKGSKYLDDFQVVSRKQVELAIWIRSYRRCHEISLQTMANLATIKGRSQNVRFNAGEIGKYENYRRIPSTRKLNVLLDVIGITLEDLN